MPANAQWTIEDVRSGACSPSELGELKPLASQEEELSHQPLDAQTQADIMAKLVEGSVTPKTQAEFNKWAQANPGSYFPLLAKHNLTRNLKEAPKVLPKLNDLNDEQIATLSSADLKRILLNSVEVKTTEQLEKLR